MTGSTRRTRRQPWRRLALLAPLLLASAPPAVSPTSGADEAIVVTGSIEREEAVRDFVDTVTIETSDQIAKFATPVCPAAFGLPAAHNEVITARVRQIADYIGIGAAGDACRPNVVIVVAERGAEFVDRLHEERPNLFSTMELIDIRRVMRLAGPVRAWQVVEQRGADGRPMDWIEVGLERRIRPSLSGVMPSITQRPTRQDLALSFIVFDLEAIEGLTLLQIADHAAMRAFARTGTAAMPTRRSILGLFADRAAGAAPAVELTNWDAAYLSALYRTGNTVSAHRQRSSIARTMRRELDSHSEPPQEQ